MPPAGFWRRYAAWSLDGAAIAIVVALVSWPSMRVHAAAIVQAWSAFQARVSALMAGGVDLAEPLPQAMRWSSDPGLLAAADALQSAVNAWLWPPVLAFAILGLAYHAWCEASARQATPGQRALGLRIVDADGRAITKPRAALRHVAGALSWITLNVGHAMALIPPRRLALHDLVSGTRVQQADGDAALPGWARVWIAAQGIALVWVTVASAMAASHAMQAAIEGTL